MRKLYKPLLICHLYFIMLLLLPDSVFAQGQADAPVDSSEVAEFKRFGFIDVNGYYDTRDANTFTINYLGVLSEKLTYFSFINYQQFSFTDENDDFNDFYSEHMLYYSPMKTLPFDLVSQAVFMGGSRNDKLRLGINWRAHDTPWLGEILRTLNIKYAPAFHLLQFGYQQPLDDFTWQIEHVWSVQILPRRTNNRIYLSGFADQTIGGEIARGLISETQLGLRIIDQFYAVGSTGI